jgi:hypothetical protein
MYARRTIYLRRTIRGARVLRDRQQLLCQCLRSVASPRSSAGQTTTCATPGTIS